MQRRRWYARPWLWLTLALILLGLWLARGPLLGPVVAGVAASSLAEATGGQVRIAGATGGWLGDAGLTGVELQGRGWHVSVRQVEAAYGIGLLGGDPGALRSVSATGVQAHLDLDAMGSAGPGEWPALLADLPSSLPGLHADGAATLRAAGHELRLHGVDLAIVDGLIELRLQRVSVAGFDVLPPPIRLRRNGEILRLDGPVPLPLADLSIEHLELTLGAATRRLLVDGRLAGGTWKARIDAGSIAAEVQGVDAVALGLLPPTLGPILVDAAVEREGSGWKVRDLRISTAGITVHGSAVVETAPLRCRDIAATVAIDLAARAPGLHGTVLATLRGGVPLDRLLWPQGDLELTVAGDGIIVGGTACDPLRLAARLSAGLIHLQTLEGGWNGIRAKLAEAPEVAADPIQDGWRLLPRSIAIGGGLATLALGGDALGAISGELQLDGLPLAGLPMTGALRHLTGTMAATLRLGGTIAAPTWSGAARLDGVEAKLSADIPTLTGGQVRLSIEPGLLRLDELRGDLGGAALTASGSVRLDGGDDTISLRIQGANLLLLQRHDARLRADLDLRLGGSLRSPLLAGEVVVASALITPELHAEGASAGLADDRIILFELPDPPLSTLRFDVRVRSTTETGPDRGVRVVTRWGRGTCDLDLRLGGTGALPAPEGRVSIRDGVATLPFSTLKVTHGELVFPPGDPFQPRLTATAGARIRDYDVQAQVTGTLAQPVIHVTGSGLDEQEALMLLTTGSTPRELQDPQSQKAALGRVGVWLGQETWRDLEGLDGIDDGPSLTERLVITWGRERSEQGRDTIDTEVELTEPGSTPAVLLYGERDRWDQYNAGVILRLSWGGEP